MHVGIQPRLNEIIAMHMAKDILARQHPLKSEEYLDRVRISVKDNVTETGQKTEFADFAGK